MADFRPSSKTAVLNNLSDDLGVLSDDVARKFSFIDFWSDPENNLTVTNSAADIAFPNIAVAGLPSGLTIKRIVLMLTIRAMLDTSGADNYINAASKTLRIKKSTGAWGTDDIIAITFANQSLYTVASTKEPGPVIVGDTDLSSVVDGNATYNVQSDQTNRSDAIVALGADLELYDIQVGLRVFYA